MWFWLRASDAESGSERCSKTLESGAPFGVGFILAMFNDAPVVGACTVSPIPGGSGEIPIPGSS